MTEEPKETFSMAQNPPDNGLEFESSKQIISSISHELRTPLAIISSNIQLLKKFSYGLDSKMVRETFSLCEEAVGAMTSFIEDIHFLNVSNKGQLKAVFQNVELEPFFKEFVDRISDSDFNRKRIHVETTLEVPYICCDKHLLFKVLAKLVDNALKFSGERIDFTVSSSQNGLIAEVADQGVGIPPEEISAIYEPFKRCGNVRMITGCGLGLAIAKTCTDALNGEIEVASELGKGTRFKIKIPDHEC